MHHFHLRSILLVGTVAACSADRDAGRNWDQPGPADDADTDAAGDGDGDPSDSDKFDVGGGTGEGAPGGGDEQNEACERMDFLFVVDNSGSMADEQQNLVASFPDFITTIRGVTDVTDYQIMVVDTDECVNGEGASEAFTCDAVADASCCDSLCTTFPAATCNLAACGGCPAGGPCDNRLGTGKVTDKTGDDCSIEGGRRYMLDTQADLDETFACVAEVGTKGSGNEQTMEAMGNAISPGLNADGACNDGFVRDDALLVIVIITDEEDDHETVSSGYAGFGSNGDPVHWYDFVVDVKGDPKHAAVLSLVGPAGADACSPLDKENGDAIDGAEVAHRILEFTEMFPFGFVGPVCAPNYNSFFEEAVEIVKEACDAFDQPG